VTDTDRPDEQLGFAAAMDELTALVDELESDALDVDDLTARVERAAELVQFCRERIDGARWSVEEILVRLDGTDDVGGDRDELGSEPG
jgi:exodeoxyribonuclease VII small subunit